MRRCLIGAAALALLGLAMPGEASAADCEIELVGKRYNATLRLIYSSDREYIISRPVVVSYTPPTIRLAEAPVPEAQMYVLPSCDNHGDVVDAILLNNLRHNQCVGFGGNVAGTDQSRLTSCEGIAG